MAGPFYNLINGTSFGTAGTGAFSPSAAVAGYLAWSTVPTGWIGLVKFTDGAAWEIQYSYWSGSTLSRAATTQFVSSSTGTALTLTSAAVAAMVADANDISAGAISPKSIVRPQLGATTLSTSGIAAPTVTGTASAATLASTNLMTEQLRTVSTSATTANAQAGFTSAVQMAFGFSTAGRGGYDFGCRFGTSTIPTGPRLFVGVTNLTQVAKITEVSAGSQSSAAFALDSTDTIIQLMTNNSTTTATKTNTGIALVANGWYEARIWQNPGSATVNGLLIRRDTGAIWYGTAAGPSGGIMFPQCIGGLSATTCTAFTLNFGGFYVRPGAH